MHARKAHTLWAQMLSYIAVCCPMYLVNTWHIHSMGFNPYRLVYDFGSDCMQYVQTSATVNMARQGTDCCNRTDHNVNRERSVEASACKRRLNWRACLMQIEALAVVPCTSTHMAPCMIYSDWYASRCHPCTASTQNPAVNMSGGRSCMGSCYSN
jgi:hypothetical protein